MSRADDPAALQFPDEQQYWAMAEQLGQGHPLTDELGFHATRMPLYPALLSLWAGSDGGVIGVRICQWFVGALAAVLAACLGSRVAGAGAGLICGLLVAADPGLVGVCSLLLTETPFVTVAIALWLVGWPLLDRPADRGWGRWGAVGAASLLCVYVRPSSAGLVLGWLALLAARSGRPGGRPLRGGAALRAVGGAALALAVVLAGLLPWAMRNQRITGHWCWLTHRMGISLYDGVGPQATGASDLGNIKAMPAVAGLDEVAWNQWFLRESWRSIRQDPLRILRLAGVKLARTWSPFLHAGELRSSATGLMFAAWSIPFFVLTIAGLVVMRRRFWVCLGLLMPALYLSALHGLFVGSVRYRLGAVPTLAVFAAVALVAGYRRCRPATGDAS
ncbi:MAG: hypothetical protein GY778_09840 [bacterium]|nr:hypothetical protein [bacterium]